MPLLSAAYRVLGDVPLTRWDFVRQNPYLAEDWQSQSGRGLRALDSSMKDPGAGWDIVGRCFCKQ